MKSRVIPAYLICLSLLISVLFIGSCKKEKSQDDAAEIEASQASSESDGEAEMVFNSVFDDAMGASDEVGMAGTGVFARTGIGNTDGGAGTERPAACFTVTVIHPTPNPFPVRVIIDFGTAGCPGPGGHIRRGKIITDYTNRLLIPGAVAETIFDSFYIDNIHVEGFHRIENTSNPGMPPTNRQFKVKVTNAKLSKPNGNFTEWNSLKTIDQVEGLSTPFHPLDDVFRITGSSHGRTRRGNLLVNWESTITEPLFKRFTCRWIVKGRVRTVRPNAPNPWVAVLDFGNGTCDNQAVIFINGVPHNITLH